MTNHIFRPIWHLQTLLLFGRERNIDGTREHVRDVLMLGPKGQPRSSNRLSKEVVPIMAAVITSWASDQVDQANVLLRNLLEVICGGKHRCLMATTM